MTKANLSPATAKAVDPEKVFRDAEMFNRTADLIEKNGFVELHAPYCANKAFSLELYLKCLLRIEGTNPKRIHLLNELFDKLSKDSRDTIKTHYGMRLIGLHVLGKLHPSRPYNCPSRELTYVLTNSSNAFQGFRYFAEDLLQPGEGWLGGEVIPVVRERIIELRPEWKNLAPAILRSNSPTFPIRS